MSIGTMVGPMMLWLADCLRTTSNGDRRMAEGREISMGFQVDRVDRRTSSDVDRRVLPFEVYMAGLVARMSPE